MSYQKILEKLRKYIFSLFFVQEEEKIILVGQIYPLSSEFLMKKVNANNDISYLELTTDIFLELSGLLESFQKYQNLNSEPWTHFEIIFNQLEICDKTLVDIPQEDSWPGLYMKGISELTWTEADAYRIPYDIWKKKSKLYISEHDRFYQELLSVFERNMERVGWTVWFRGCIYQGQPQYEAFAIESDGTLHPEALELKKSQHLRLPKLLRQMQKSKLYPQPWTHFECRLGFMIPFEFKVADIAETDYWQGVYMRGIGDLSESEAEQAGIPQQIWLQHKGVIIG